MINPSGDELNNEGRRASGEVSGTQDQMARSAAEKANDAWEQTKDRAMVARERTEVFVRENPIPVLIGALGIGIAIGLAIRHASAREEPQSFGEKAWSLLSVPFLWPMWKTVREKAEDSAEVVNDAVRDGIDRVRDIDVTRYTKPIRKRWKTWTN